MDGNGWDLGRWEVPLQCWILHELRYQGCSFRNAACGVLSRFQNASFLVIIS